jgi:flagellar biosynthetic protein FlhB
VADSQEKDRKTEPASPRRRQEARENGQVAISTEFVAALMLIAGFGSVLFGGAYLARSAGGLTESMLRALGSIGTGELDVQSSAALVKRIGFSMFGPLLVVFVPAVLVGALVAYGQVGFMVTTKAVEPDVAKLDPVKGFQKIFSTRALVRTLLAAAKVLAIALVMGTIAFHQVDDIARAGDGDLGPILRALGSVALKAAAGGLAAILVLAVIDLVFQRYQHEKDLRMSKEEVKEENRIAEGDPHVKARVRQIMREMATRRMMADVPKATVVVTNPTHYAVALLYEDRAGAPRCVAKGKGFVARRIKEVAREAGIVVYEDVPLARALHAQVDVGREIPEELYAAVAEVLAYVYRLQGRAAAA